MLLWQMTLTAFMITSVVGLYLFAGYTFRVRVYYPLALVTTHVIAAAVTTVLFGVLIVHLIAAHASIAYFSLVFSLISFVMVLLTLLSGIYFYFRYEARKKRTKWVLIGTHLAMAGLSFIFAISSISTMALPKHTNTYPGSAWYKYHLRHPG